ncbi:Polysaccharide deacetylase [hydrothermal vent metagenome]|uniref:Polysaccharide deacetylase n=1 Tax=hydrothermal vent metagenome TaxID=652676 RepID=A0A1W1CK76_9ZZZZ
MKLIIILLSFWIVNVYAKNDCVVLLYHHFSEKTPKSTSISPKLFEEQLQYLQENNFNVISLSEMIEKDKRPKKCVVLTTDDAFISVYDKAYPLLKKYQMPMAVFITTQASDKKFKAMMSWEQMREIQGKFIAFYNHGVSHKHLIDLSLKEVEEEIILAQKRLEKKLGVKHKFFAYPYGEYNERIYNLVRKLGFIGFGQQSGALNDNSDLAILPRYPMADNYAKMKSFKTKVNSRAFDIKTVFPINPITKGKIPRLTLEFLKPIDKNQQKQFACFGEKGSIKPIWLSDSMVFIQDKVMFEGRRGRYNCTMPTSEKGVYYWYSKQWIKQSS